MTHESSSRGDKHAPSTGVAASFSYTVTAEFDDPAVMGEWIDWLRDGHLAEVIAGGALDAELVQFDGPAHRCAVRYHFRDRAAFERYEREFAPRLRQDGLERFPPERGVRYQRNTGVVRARK